MKKVSVPVPEKREQRLVTKELAALATIVDGFAELPAEARSRVYSYLMSRFPAPRAT